MKTRITIAFLFLVLFQVKAQRISDAASLTQAVSLAEKQNKPILLIVEAPPGSMSKMSNVRPGYKENDVVKNLKQHFLIFETNLLDKEITEIISTYRITSFPAFLFMHTSKEVFHSDFGGSTDKKKYSSMLEKALSLSKGPSGKSLEDAYLTNKTNENIKKLIEYRNHKGVGNNAELIEQFAANLKPEDFNDYYTVLFILKQGPYAYGNAYRLVNSNRKIIDSIYKHEQLNTRVDINNTIISNTLQQAIKTKNINQAQYAANYAKATHGKNINAGNRSYSSNMISYHKAINDTANYFKLAIPFYDRYYMTLSADSIKKGEEKRRIEFAEKNIKKPNENTRVVSKAEFESLKKQPPTGITPGSTLLVVNNDGQNSYATTLNNIAWSFYETGTKNINYLTKAMVWSRRSIELEPNAAYYDTLAHLLYSLGYQTEAIKTQEKAIESAKAQKFPFENMQNELKKMKNKTL